MDINKAAKAAGAQITDRVAGAAGIKRESQKVEFIDSKVLAISDSEDVYKGRQISQDSLFAAYSALNPEDSFSLFDYEFVISKPNSSGANLAISSFVFPIPPQSVNINIPTAIATTVTMRGIVEEHNGAPLRQITISGTTGVYPVPVQSAASASSKGKRGPLDYLFANTIRAVQNVGSSAAQFAKRIGSIANAFQGGGAGQLSSPVVDSYDDWSQGITNTGYVTAHNLMRFMDLYLEIKKSGKNNDVTLTFCNHKDKMFYDCTLNNLSIRKNAGSMDYLYSISLTAWRRISTPPYQERTAKGNFVNGYRERSINPFAEINRALDDGTAIISKSLGILQGFQSDIKTNILNPIKKTRLFVKTVLNSPKTATAYSDTIAASIKDEIKQKWTADSESKNRGGSFTTASSATSFGPRGIGSHEELKEKMARDLLLHAYGGEPQRDGKASTSPFDISIQQTENKTSGPNKPGEDNQQVDPLYDMFANPDAYFDILDTIDMSTIEVNESTRQLIAEEEEDASQITSEDVYLLREELDAFTALFSQKIGGNSAEFNRVYGKSNFDSSKSLTTEDIEFLSVLNDMSLALDKLTVELRNAAIDSDQDYSRFYGAYARTQGIDFVDGLSKFYIPFPLGYSLESLALQYLGDVDRWIEIAAINGLKEPYIDETGFYRSFRSSGSGNSFLVNDSSGLYIGQIILIESLTQRPEVRRINSIKVISSIQSLIVVDGRADLSRFTATDNARLKAFAPNTVNSNMMIAIPSQVPANIITNMRINPNERDIQNVAYLAQSDFLLGFDQTQGTADVQMIGNDVAIARAYQNLSQAAFLKLYTNQGDLLNDPNFGSPIQVGSSISEFNPDAALNALASQFAEDGRFTGLRAGRVTQLNGAVNIELLLGVSGASSYLPIKTVVPTN